MVQPRRWPILGSLIPSFNVQSGLLIGEQCWFAENRRNTNYSNGDAIPAGMNNREWQSTTAGAMAVYGEGNSACDTFRTEGDLCDESWSLVQFGRLYNWYAVSDARGLCPNDWHTSTDQEWTNLIDFLGGASVAGDKMKTTSGWGSDGNGTNSSGFSAVPGGIRTILQFNTKWIITSSE